MSSLNILMASGHVAVLAAVSAANSATSTTAKPATSSALSYLPFLLLIAVGGYLLFIRPRNQAMRRQQAVGQEISVGDRVLTRAGIVGRVKGFNGDRVLLEISQGVVIEVVRQGVGQKLADELDDDDLIPPPPGAEDLDDGDADGEHLDAEGEAGEEWGAAEKAEDWGQGEREEDWRDVAAADAPAAADPFDVQDETPGGDPSPDEGEPDQTAPASGRRRGRGARR